MLFIISTPIGNLGDLTYRATAVLKECDYLLCEDTRHSRVLLRHYDIECPLVSYHQHNESERIEHALIDLQEGKRLGLLSDAGTPTIADPGQRLIEACHSRGIAVCPLPGPCAAITALAAAGLSTSRFQFLGFLPRTPGQRKKNLIEALNYPGTTIFYESPQRLCKTLEALTQLCPSAQIAVARELTKHYEEIKRSSAADLTAHYSTHPPKGEIVLLIAGNTGTLSTAMSISPEKEIALLQKQGYTLSTAIKEVAFQRGLSKRSLYRELHIAKPADPA